MLETLNDIYKKNDYFIVSITCRYFHLKPISYSVNHQYYCTYFWSSGKYNNSRRDGSKNAFSEKQSFKLEIWTRKVGQNEENQRDNRMVDRPVQTFVWILVNKDIGNGAKPCFHWLDNTSCLSSNYHSICILTYK